MLIWKNNQKFNQYLNVIKRQLQVKNDIINEINNNPKFFYNNVKKFNKNVSQINYLKTKDSWGTSDSDNTDVLYNQYSLFWSEPWFTHSSKDMVPFFGEFYEKICGT